MAEAGNSPARTERQVGSMAAPRKGKQEKKTREQQLVEDRALIAARGEQAPESEGAILARGRFLRLAEKRVTRALKAMQGVERLFGPGYSASAPESEKIAQAVATGAQSVVQAAKGEKVKAEGFTL